MARTSGVSIAGCTCSSVTPGWSSCHGPLDPARLPARRAGTEVVGEHDALGVGQLPEREAGVALAHGRRQPHGQAELAASSM